MNASFTPFCNMLWVEDGAKYELHEFLGALYFSRKCRLELAQDASRAMSLLSTREFDAIIADIRLPPGNHLGWQKMYQQNGGNKSRARLGLLLLDWMINARSTVRETMKCCPVNIHPERVAVFTIESYDDMAAQLAILNITRSRFVQKKTTTPDTILVDIMDQLLGKRAVEVQL